MKAAMLGCIEGTQVNCETIPLSQNWERVGVRVHETTSEHPPLIPTFSPQGEKELKPNTSKSTTPFSPVFPR
jgi:hypothetical protein